VISVLIDSAEQSFVDREKIRKVIESFLKKQKIDDVEISLKFVGREEMRRLNRDYRDLDEPTTILAFSQQEQKKGLAFKKPPRTVRNLGDLVLCREEMEKKGLSLDNLLVHGLKNLLRFDGQSGLLTKISTAKDLRT